MLFTSHFKNIGKFLQLNRCHKLGFERFNSTFINEAREKFSVLGGGKIELERDEAEGIATITISNSSKRNALSGKMMTQLEEIVNILETWETGKCVILKSVGEIFSSGVDISDQSTGKLQYDGTLMSTYMHHVLSRLFSIPLISVTLVHGKAIGGGAELTTSTDFRAFTETGEVGFVQGKMGVTTGFGGGTRLVKILGPRIALDLLTTTRRLKCSEALEIGYADTVVKGGDHYEETLKWISEKLSLHYSIIRAMKKVVVGARDSNLETSLLNEREVFTSLWGGPLQLEALRKALKRK